MKKIVCRMLLLSCISLLNSSVVGYADSVDYNPVAPDRTYATFSFVEYHFKDIPPLMYKGMKRVFYRYDEKIKLYIGLYN